MSTILLYSFLCELSVLIFSLQCIIFSNLKTMYKTVDIWILEVFFRMFYISNISFHPYTFVGHFFLPCLSHLPPWSSFLLLMHKALGCVQAGVGGDCYSLFPRMPPTHKFRNFCILWTSNEATAFSLLSSPYSLPQEWRLVPPPLSWSMSPGWVVLTGTPFCLVWPPSSLHVFLHLVSPSEKTLLLEKESGLSCDGPAALAKNIS